MWRSLFFPIAFLNALLCLSAFASLPCRTVWIALDEVFDAFSGFSPELSPSDEARQKRLTQLLEEYSRVSPGRRRRPRPGTSPSFAALRATYLADLDARRRKLRETLHPELEAWFSSTGNTFTRDGDVFIFSPDTDGGAVNRYAAEVKKRTGAQVVLNLNLELAGGVHAELPFRRQELSFRFVTQLAATRTEGHELRHLAFTELLEKGGTSLFQGEITAFAESVSPKSGYDGYVSFEEILAHAFTLKKIAETYERENVSERLRLRKYAVRASRLSRRISESAQAALTALEQGQSVDLETLALISGETPVAKFNVAKEKFEIPLPELAALHSRTSNLENQYRTAVMEVLEKYFSTSSGSPTELAAVREFKHQRGAALFEGGELSLEAFTAPDHTLGYRLRLRDGISIGLERGVGRQLFSLKAGYQSSYLEELQEASETLIHRLSKLSEVASDASESYAAVGEAVREKASNVKLQAMTRQLDEKLAQYFVWDPRGAQPK